MSSPHLADEDIVDHVTRSDKQLAELVLEGDETAFEELFDRHKRLVVSIFELERRCMHITDAMPA